MDSVRIDANRSAPVDLRAHPRPSATLSVSNAFLGGSSSDKNYVFVQHSAEDTWVIHHPLNKYPSVTIIDSGGNVCIGDVLYVSTSEVHCFFTAPFAGKAYLN